MGEQSTLGSTVGSATSPLAGRPYDLRHACLSTWLNGGVYPTQVVGWAGHRVGELLRIYAKCVVGQDELAKRRITEALGRNSHASLTRSNCPRGCHRRGDVDL